MARASLLLLVPALLLAGCGNNSGSDAERVEVYKATGAVQCEGGGMSLNELAGPLREAGIELMGESCGHDGMMRPAVCGASDGSIGIFLVNAGDQTRASDLGFEPMSSLPEATLNDCPGT